MDEETFKQIFRQYNKRLIHFADRMLLNKGLAEDVVAEVFEALWEKESVYIENIHRLLFEMTKNNILNKNKHTRKFGYHQSDITLHEIITDESEADRQATHSELLGRIVHEIENCPPAQRKIMYLKYHGYDNKEISKALGISMDTIRVQVMRFRDVVRYKFQND